MAKKNQLTKAEFIKMGEMKRVISDLNTNREYNWCLYFTFSTATVLRISDVLSTKWEDVIQIKGGKPTVNKVFNKIEKKTGKHRAINFSKSVAKRIADMYIKLESPELDSFIFSNKFGNPMSTQYINRQLKRIKKEYDINIDNFSTHTFRKTFAREFWEQNNRSSESLVMLMKLLNHSSLAMTELYLGVTSEAIADVYTSFEL